MNVLLDMNISIKHVPSLIQNGFTAVHWSEVGSPTATDQEIAEWAKDHDHVIVTHDLDFGAILAASGLNGPSVVQLRLGNMLSDSLATLLSSVLNRLRPQLEEGCLIVIDESKTRVRILPL